MTRLIALACLVLWPASLRAADDPAPVTYNPAIYDGIFTDGPLTNFSNLAGRTDENGYVRISMGTPGVIDGPLTNFPNLRARTDENGYLRVSLAGASTISVPNIQTTSTNGVLITNPTATTVSVTAQYSPSLIFTGGAWKSNATAANEIDSWKIENRPVTGAAVTTTSLWFAVSIAGGAYTDVLQVRNDGTILAPLSSFIATGAGFQANTNGNLIFGSRSIVNSPADGNLVTTNAAATIGVRFKADALPTVGSGFGTSPSVTAGSTPIAGSVNVGTGGTATSGVITFGGTAFPSAPFCVADTVTSNTTTRVTSTTTQLTLTTTVAWTASDVVTWICISSK